MCREAGQSAFLHHSCIYLRILIISYLATFLGTNNLSVLMCRKAVNQSIKTSLQWVEGAWDSKSILPIIAYGYNSKCWSDQCWISLKYPQMLCRLQCGTLCCLLVMYLTMIVIRLWNITRPSSVCSVQFAIFHLVSPLWDGVTRCGLHPPSYAAENA